LRAKRSNPDIEAVGGLHPGMTEEPPSWRCANHQASRSLDCFASLAMTINRLDHKPSRPPEKDAAIRIGGRGSRLDDSRLKRSRMIYRFA
jgi:hypothetical protein